MQWKVLPQENSDILEQLLINRGLKSPKEKEKFLAPKLEDFEKDLQIPGISKAKSRILKAIKDNELIIAFGDYDVDGLCGSAILYLGLTSIGAKVLPYIPHREKEGYGLSKVGLDYALSQGAKLVITTDCGIVSFEEADYAKKLGLELIITDHHQTLKDKLPQAFAIIHSTKICGATVAWCLVRTLMEEKKSKDLLDLVAIATIADMMRLLEVNRSLVKTGLNILNKTTRVGLLALFNEAELKLGSIGAYEIGHIIAPRLNAMGRLENAMDALRLICTKDPVKAKKLANLVSETNSLRRKLTQDAIEGARLKITAEKKIYVLSDKDWSPGIISLVAGRICEETRRPTIAIALGETHSKGSARSSNGINIVEVIRKCQDILVAVGGHPYAAGFTIQTSKIKEFEKRLEGLIEEADLVPGNQVLDIEMELKENQIKKQVVLDLQQLEPFGLGNPKPIFASFNMKLSDLKTVGSGKHLKGKVEGVEFIAFGMGELKEMLGDLADFAYTLEIDRFNGAEKLQLVVKDIHLI